MQHSELHHLVATFCAPYAKYIIMHAHRFSQIVQRCVGNQSTTWLSVGRSAPCHEACGEKKGSTLTS